MTSFAIAAAFAALVSAPARPADPPVAKPPATEPTKEEPAKGERRRPTTVEEFAALAKGGPKPPWLPFDGEIRVKREHVQGTVVAVSREAIEVQLKGTKETVKYPPHTLLDTGAVCHWESDSVCYLLDDVKKGDVVILAVGTVDAKKGKECFYLSIRERPGGVVPASRKPSGPKPYHVRQQDELDTARNPKVKPPAAEPKEGEAATQEDRRPVSKEDFAALARQGPKRPWAPREGESPVKVEHLDGTVVDVSRRFIEIQLPGKKETVKYAPHTLLDTGAVCHWESDSVCYLLDDVRKGDVVILGVGTVDRQEGLECFFLSIRERPGGVVPASRKPSWPKPYHVEQQKKLDDAKNGIVRPEKQPDPPVAKPPTTEPKKDEPTKEEKKRPTTKEDFAALAKEGPKPPWMPFSGIGHKVVRDEIKFGTVVAVSADAIEIRPSKKKEETIKYPPHALLASGAVCHWVSDAHCYLLDDVQKGDVVILGVGTVDEEKGPECFYVRIHERPGGVVPPSRKPHDTKPHHLEREYELYYERQGLKTPEELKTADEKRRFLADKGIQLPPAGAGGDPKKKD